MIHPSDEEPAKTLPNGWVMLEPGEKIPEAWLYMYREPKAEWQHSNWPVSADVLYTPPLHCAVAKRITAEEREW